MPRKISQNRTPGDVISSDRLNHINDELDNIYENGDDIGRVSLALSGDPLKVDIGAFPYSVHGNYGQYAGTTDLAIADNSTKYILINSSGVISQANATDADKALLAIVTTLGGTITNIANFKSAVFGGYSGTGDLNGPGSAEVGNIPTFSSVTGKEVVDSGMSIADVIAEAGDSTYKLTNEDFPAGESIVKGDFMYPENLLFTEVVNSENVGDVIGNTRKSFPFWGNGIEESVFNVGLKKTGSPNIPQMFRIETDSNGPSGTEAFPGVKGSIYGSSLSTTPAKTDIMLYSDSEHGVTLNNTIATQYGYKGMRITLNKQVKCLYITKNASCTATKAYIYDTNKNLLASASFVDDVATINYSGWTIGNDYYVMAGSDGSAYTAVKQTGSASYPYNTTNANYDAGVSYYLQQIDTSSCDSIIGPIGLTNTMNITFTAINTRKLVSFSGGTFSGNAVLKDGSDNIIETATGGGIFSGNTILTAGNTYKIEWTVSDAYYYSSTSLPQQLVNINLTAFSTGYTYTIVDVVTSDLLEEDNNVYNISSISLETKITTVANQKYHMITYVGTYGSETIDSSNYYGISYSENETTMKGMRTWDGGSWGSYTNNKWAYFYSKFCINTFLLRTDASKTYRIGEKARISTDNYNMFDVVKYDTDGLTKLLSNMVELSPMYLSNTPGAISTVPGTNVVNVGIVQTNDKLLLNKNTGPMYVVIGLVCAGTTVSQIYYAKYKSTIYGILNTSNYGSGQTSRAYLQISYDGINWITIEDFIYGGSGAGEGIQDYFKLPVQAGTYIKVGINTNRGYAEISGYSGF